MIAKKHRFDFFAQNRIPKTKKTAVQQSMTSMIMAILLWSRAQDTLSFQNLRERSDVMLLDNHYRLRRGQVAK